MVAEVFASGKTGDGVRANWTAPAECAPDVGPVLGLLKAWGETSAERARSPASPAHLLLPGSASGARGPGVDLEAWVRTNAATSSGVAKTQVHGATANLQKTVGILLCTCHGQDYLRDQLRSIAAQTHQNWKLWVSDDGSADGTLDILEEFRRECGPERVLLHAGPLQGFAANFLSLVCNGEIKADYYAYADQDDIWEADKLQRGIERLQTVDDRLPALYCTRTRLVDAHDRHIGYSPLFSKPPGFANALMQNIGGGNTMLFNDAARQLLCAAGKNVNVVSHDWWAYLLVSGCGGHVFYDAHASLRYRQHGGNIVGRNTGVLARIARLRMLWQGRFRLWHDLNLQALERVRHRLTPENQLLLARFAKARRLWLLPRLLGLKRCGIYRQTLPGNIGLAAAAIFNKI
jgi:glycosyltransferase involved in cell wall biosynthesis